MKKSLRGKGKHLISFFIVALMLALPVLGLTAIHSASAQAQDIINGAQSNLTNTGLIQLGGEGTDLPATVGRIVGILLGLLGVVFVILVIFAGFNWMMAQGDETKIAKARKTIIQGVVAIIIIFAAYAITSFVITQIGGAAANPNG